MNWHKDYLIKHRKYFFKRRVADMDMLYPPFRILVAELIYRARKAGLNVEVYETYRSVARQIKLWALGRTKLKKRSMHHYGIAADIVFKTKKGYWTWVGDWDKLIEIASKELGLECGGNWSRFKDYNHFQLVPATVEAQKRIIMGEYPSCV